ncbi:MAG TPA: GH32 C-terminal domain-containing protein [Prolixibacteraceae bacterium]|nr:GH32 C-terminal domain-containing protein [Prolixibacteraceae bacterium]
MNKIPFLLLAACFSVASHARKNEPAPLFGEEYRPRFHFTIASNRLAAPVSMVKSDSTYHLFYQYNPTGLQTDTLQWGHASSTDLLHWNFHEPVLVPVSGQSGNTCDMPGWGTVVALDHTFSAFYNIPEEGIFKTGSNDEFLWWKKDKVKGADILHSADPFVFWHEPTLNWVMLAYNHSDSTQNIFRSPDGLNWENTSTFNFRFTHPGLIELPVDRKADDTRWFFFTSKGNCLLTRFDGSQMELLTPLTKFDYGTHTGASLCFYDPDHSRHILISELQSEQMPDLPTNGMFTFPSELSLHETPSGIEIRRKPIRELERLYEKKTIIENKKIYPGINNNLLSRLRGKTYHIKGVFDLLNCDQVGFILRCDRENNGTEINYHVPRKSFSAPGGRIDYEPKGNKMEFELLIDHSTLEIYLDGGNYFLSAAFTAAPENNRYLLYTIGGEVMVEYLEINELGSVWNQ